ncbi:hypothetical protein ACW2Q0_04830 [Nocardia sp. R16R-3T]
MPAYARNGKVVCYFRTAEKCESRYATFGFDDIATLDDGTMWPTAFALTKSTGDDQERLAALIGKPVG